MLRSPPSVFVARSLVWLSLTAMQCSALTPRSTARSSSPRATRGALPLPVAQTRPASVAFAECGSRLFDPDTDAPIGARLDQSGRYVLSDAAGDGARIALSESFVLRPSALVRGAPFTERLLTLHRRLAALTLSCVPRLSQRGYDEWSLQPAPRFAILLRASAVPTVVAQVRPALQSAFSACVEGRLRELRVDHTELCGDLWIEFPEERQGWIRHSGVFEPSQHPGVPLAGWPISLAPRNEAVFELANGQLIVSDQDPFSPARRVHALNEWWVRTHGDAAFDVASPVYSPADATAP